MQALISPNEPVLTGYRVAQVATDDQVFPVADPLFWASCADTTVADVYWFDPSDSQIKLVSPVGEQPVTNGAQTL